MFSTTVRMNAMDSIFGAPNVNMQMMGTGFDDGMNQAWSLDIAGEDWHGRQVSALIGHTGPVF